MSSCIQAFQFFYNKKVKNNLFYSLIILIVAKQLYLDFMLLSAIFDASLSDYEKLIGTWPKKYGSLHMCSQQAHKDLRIFD